MSLVNPENAVRSVALISDTHVWSDYALVSNTPVYDKKRHVNPPEALSRGQLTIQSYWYNRFIPTAEEFNVDTIIHFGDGVQGCNPK